MSAFTKKHNQKQPETTAASVIENPKPAPSSGLDVLGQAQEASPDQRALLACGVKVHLTSEDLIRHEARLKSSLARFINFKGHSLYFPTGNVNLEPKWLPSEKKLLLPLVYDNNILGVFVASGAEVEAKDLPFYSRLTTLCLENLLLYKSSLIDPGTGLFSKQYLLNSLTLAVRNIREAFSLESSPDLGRGLNPGCLGVLLINFRPLVKVGREYGYAFADEFAALLAQKLQDCLPEQALAASSGDVSFAVFLPQAAYAETLRLAREIAASLATLERQDPLTGAKISLPVAVGCACYPQDAETGSPRKSSAEEARLLLTKARVAASHAWDADLLGTGPNRPAQTQQPQPEAHAAAAPATPAASAAALPAPLPVLGFNQILQKSGKILQCLPLDRVEINLGLGVGAKEGQHFKVYTLNPDGSKTDKAELVLLSVQENQSLAEIIHLNNLGDQIFAGDRLEFLPSDSLSFLTRSLPLGLAPADKNAATTGPAEGQSALPNLLPYREFLASWAEAREQYDEFCLCLLRLSAPAKANSPEESLETQTEPGSKAGPSSLPANGPALLEAALAATAKRCACLFEAKAFGGKYAEYSLSYFIPQTSPDEVRETLKILCEDVQQEFNLTLAVGVAKYPFLNFRKSEALDNAAKALDYAMLLPHPKVGLIDSLALNIRADRHFSQGDIFAAINEYKLALLEDEKNTTAWTSLGVCFASIDNFNESRRCFEQALLFDPCDVQAVYNLAQICQAEGDLPAARAYYAQCLEREPDHVYARLRLGQLAEQTEDYDNAKKHYLEASEHYFSKGVAARHLARLALAMQNTQEAREYLHQALTQNPQDALALGMLAEIYLSEGDNPEIALTLARQSVALRRDYRAGWLALGKALEACGQNEQARQARLRAADL